MNDDAELLAEMEQLPARRAALDSRVRTVLLAAVRRDNAAYLTLLRYVMMDNAATMDALLISFARVYCEDLVACQGQQLTEARLEQDIAFGRERVLEELQ